MKVWVVANVSVALIVFVSSLWCMYKFAYTGQRSYREETRNTFYILFYMVTTPIMSICLTTLLFGLPESEPACKHCQIHCH